MENRANRTTPDFIYQPDKLEEAFLIQYYIWNPQAEDYRPEELQFDS